MCVTLVGWLCQIISAHRASDEVDQGFNGGPGICDWPCCWFQRLLSLFPADGRG